MKKIRITWNGELLREVFPHATRWQVFKYKVRRFTHKAMIVIAVTMGVSFVGLTSFAVGAEITQPAISIITPTADQLAAPVLERIANCESGGRQYNAHGQVVLNPNTNGSVDIGKYQINEAKWGAKATAMGLDLTKPADNYTMALWIYENIGTAPWYSSQACWQR